MTGNISDSVASQTSYIKNEAENVQNIRKNADYGKTVGKPELSEKAADYYESLKKKFGNMDFILVSRDQKENAKAMASSFANPYRMVVLIDEDKIERMATDESFRTKYEGLIANAASGLSQLKARMDSSTASNIVGYGLTVNEDGSTDFFAVLRKSSEAQKERIEKKHEENLKARKEAKKEANEEVRERILDKDEETLGENDVEIIMAKSIEDLERKISDYNQNERMNSVMTEAEKMVGQHIDFKG